MHPSNTAGSVKSLFLFLSVSSLCITFAVASFPLSKEKGTQVSLSCAVQPVGASSSLLKHLSILSIFSQQTDRKTNISLTFLPYKIYTEVDHLHFSDLMPFLGPLCMCSLALSTAKESVFVLFFYTKINSTFNLLSILWSQTGHVKQYFSQISIFPFLNTKIYSIKMQ